MKVLLALTAVIAIAAACNGDGEPDAPPGPYMNENSDRDPPFGPGDSPASAGGLVPGGGDGGSFFADAAGATPFIAPGCIPVDQDDRDNFARLFEQGIAVPFPVSAAFARVAADARGNETLLIALTDGACERGVGRQLVFEADAGSVGRDVVVGDNVIGTEPDTPLRVRFNDFSDPGVPAIFGTCSDASGAITFGELGTSDNALVRATFPGIRLGSCNGGTAGARTLDVDGGFAVTLP